MPEGRVAISRGSAFADSSASEEFGDGGLPAGAAGREMIRCGPWKVEW